MFENTAIREGWERVKTGRDCWCPYSLVRLQQAYFALPILGVRQIYPSSRRKSWSAWGFSPVCVAQYFHDWEYKPHLPARAQAAELFPSCSILAFGWGAHSGPDSGARRRQPTPPCSPEDSQPRFRDVEPRHHWRTCRGPWSWRTLPITGMLGSKHRHSPEGGPGCDARRKAPFNQ